MRRGPRRPRRGASCSRCPWCRPGRAAGARSRCSRRRASCASSSARSMTWFSSRDRLGLRARLLRVAADVPLDALAELADVHAELLQDRDDDALLLREQRVQEVQVVDERIPVLAGEPERVVERFGRLYGEAIWVDHETGCRMSDVGCRMSDEPLPAPFAKLASLERQWQCQSGCAVMTGDGALYGGCEYQVWQALP